MAMLDDEGRVSGKVGEGHCGAVHVGTIEEYAFASDGSVWAEGALFGGSGLVFDSPCGAGVDLSAMTVAVDSDAAGTLTIEKATLVGVTLVSASAWPDCYIGSVEEGRQSDAPETKEHPS
jgi:hypothetical protein